MSEEHGKWKRMVEELQALPMPIAAIAEEVGAEDRQVWRWKAGEDIPKGMKAVKLYLLHVKRCPVRQCPTGHIADGEKAA